MTPLKQDEQTLIHAKNISVKRSGRTLLSHADLVLEAGKIVTLIGPNGAGKTTLVRSVLGLCKINEGVIHRRANLRIGYMPQKLHIDPSLPLTVERFLTLAGEKSITESLSRTGALHLQTAPLQTLSGGEMQRVLLARALLGKPDLLVLDEPVQGVDVTGQAALYALINEIREEYNCGVLLVSHDLHLVMATTDTVVCLNQHVCCHGHPEQITTDPAYIALFGSKADASIALYTHHHDHTHNDRGDVIEPCEHTHA